MADLAGMTLGNYRILERAGKGGMATVYKAYDPGMDRQIAIKVLPEEFADDPLAARGTSPCGPRRRVADSPCSMATAATSPDSRSPPTAVGSCRRRMTERSGRGTCAWTPPRERRHVTPSGRRARGQTDRPAATRATTARVALWRLAHCPSSSRLSRT